MTKASFPTDTITLKDISTGGGSAGNGGEGYNKGDITSTPTINFSPYNKADGAYVNVNTGDKVDQKAYWDAGGANAKADDYSKAYGGHAYSNGDQSSWSGHDTSYVSADTTAYQSNFVAADMSQHVAAGIGGYGGNDNYAKGGDFETANLNDVLNHSTHFTIDDLVHV
jgi:hypothetical protein